MSFVFLINVLLSMAMGLALWAVWSVNRDEAYVRNVANMNLVSVFIALSFWVWKESPTGGFVHLISGIASAVGAAAALTFISLAVFQLAGKKPARKTVGLYFAVLGASYGTIVGQGNAVLAGIFNLMLYGALGVYAIARMWSMGRSHRLIGVFLLLLGLNAVNLILLGTDGAMYQYGIGGILRVAMGMAVTHIAFSATHAKTERVRQAFEQLSDRSLQGIAVISGDKVMYANPALLKMFGYASMEDAASVGPWAAVLEQRKYATAEDTQAMFAGSRHFFEVERDALRADGAKIHIQLSSWSTLWEGQPAVQFVVVDHTAKHAAAQQVLELQAAQEAQRAEFAEKAKLALLASNAELEDKVAQRTRELEEASRAKSLFLANMSHEIRTPMNAILGMLQLLQGTQLKGRQAEYTLKAQGAAKALLRLLNDILDFSKMDAGKMRLELEPFAVEHMLRDLQVLIDGARGDKPIDIAYDIDPGVPKVVVGDSTRLLQVLINLCTNAIKFTEQGSVTLQIHRMRVTDSAVTLRIRVSDTGIGIAPENQEHIFELFAQAEASTTRRFGGTGLGLSICRHLLSLMGSALELTSQLGQGSTFQFELTLPLPHAVTGAVLPVAAGERDSEAARLKGVRILVVEDNPLNQYVVRELLQNNGAVVDVANNGRIAVEYMGSHRAEVDVILMDMQMPEMDGCEATLHIRNVLGNTQTPIIAMTANSMPSDREACLAAGMNDHVGKPFEINHLINVIGKHLGRRNAVDTALPSAATTEQSAGLPVPLLDLEAALEYMGGDRELFEQLVAIYMEDVKNAPLELQAHVDAGDGAAAHKLLHTLKGTSATLGATRLSRQAQDMEMAVKQNLQVLDIALFRQTVQQTLDALCQRTTTP